MKTKGNRTIIYKLASVVMVLMMTLALTPMLSDVAYAAEDKTQAGLGLGVSDLNNPAEGAGGWCKVYYGSAKTPLRFNVLNKNETVFSNASTPTLLLDCDSIVRTGHAGASQIYEWSQIAGTFEFIGDEYFTEAEAFALLNKSRKNSPAADDLYPFPAEDNKEYEFEALGGSGAYVFTLDASEFMNQKYGFPANMSATDLRKKAGGAYWVRSRNGGTNASLVGYVKSDGSLGKQMYNIDSGFSPTTNIDLSRILFTSLISGTSGQAGAEYKLTIIDDKRKGSSDLRTYFKTEVTGPITRDGDVITIPFKVSGNRKANATQVSVLITDKAWNADGAKILKYGKMDITSGSVTDSGSGTFELPAACYRASGSDYYAYVFAEDVNDGNFTDFASPPVTMTIPAAKMQVTATPYESAYDGAAHGIEVKIAPSGISKIATIKYGNSEGIYDLDTAPKRTKVGEQTVYYQVSAEGFETVTGSSKITITHKPLTVIGAKANDKTYDGNTSATFEYFTLKGEIATDDIKATATGTFEDKNAGTGKAVNISDYELTGADKDNYKLAESGHVTTTTASIFRRPVKITGAEAQDKEYDGTENASFKADKFVLDTVLPGDDVGATATGTFADKNAGTGKTVNIASYTLTGADQGNYMVAADSLKTTTANITPKPVKISGITAENKDYDGNTTATINTGSASIEGVLSGDTVSVASATGTFADKKADQNKTVTLSDITLGGADAGNYTPGDGSQTQTEANILRREVTFSGIQAQDKVYDGSNTATFNYDQVVFENKVTGDDLGVSAVGTFGDKNVGTDKTVTISSYVFTGADQGNYMPGADVQKTATADITPKSVLVLIPDANKVYDGTTDSPSGYDITKATISDLIEGDDISVAGGNPAFEDANAGDSIFAVYDLAYAGADANNYELPTGAEILGKITKKSLTVSGITAKNKNYDGKKDAQLVTSGMKVEGIVTDDDVTVKPSGTFENASAGKGKKVSITYKLSGDKAGNYEIDLKVSQSVTNADIISPEPKPEPKPEPTPTPTPAAKIKTALVAKGIASGKKAIKFTWTKVENASGYDIYFSRCDYKGKTYKPKKVKTVKGSKTLTWTKKGLAKNTCYKAYVRAYKIKNGKKTYIKRSPMIHVCTGNERKSLTNPKSITVSKTKVTLKKGKTAKVKAKVTKVYSGLKFPDDHTARVRYLSSDKKIATVTKSGKIKAKKKGRCYVYVCAQNGLWKRVKVTVK